MKITMQVLLGVVGLALVGCDYTVPLVQTPVKDIDTALIGRWRQTEPSDQKEQLLVLPLSPREILIVYPAGSKDALFARGTLWSQNGLTLMQLNWFGTAQGQVPKDARTYQYANFALDGNVLGVRLLNPETIDRAVASPAALLEAILAAQNNPKLYRQPMVFSKIEE